MLERAAESLNYCQQSIRPGCGLKNQSKLRTFVKIFDGKFLISLVFLKLLSLIILKYLPVVKIFGGFFSSNFLG